MSTPAFPTKTDARMTSPFGRRTHPVTGEVGSFHSGTDYAPKVPGTPGYPIYAVMDGVVRRRQAHITMGNHIYLEHTGDSYTSVYMHLASFTVAAGQTVRKGQQIGVMGATGRVTGIHLHLMIATSYPPDHFEGGNLIDPEQYLQGAVEGGAPIVPISENRYLNMEEMKNNAEYIYAWLKEKGWTKNAIAGMLGNMQTESTINPGIWQNLDSGNLRLGVGLVQWTPATKLIDWATPQELDPFKMDTQLGRIEWEVANGGQWIATSKYPMSFSEFKESTLPPYELGMAFLLNYERPADQNQPDRGTQAEYWFDNLEGTGMIDPEDPYDDIVKKQKELYIINSRRFIGRRR